MNSVKYIGMDVHKEAISIAVLNSTGKLVMECVIETKASPRPSDFGRESSPDQFSYQNVAFALGRNQPLIENRVSRGPA
jgi:hypothetical protein